MPREDMEDEEDHYSGEAEQVLEEGVEEEEEEHFIGEEGDVEDDSTPSEGLDGQSAERRDGVEDELNENADRSKKIKLDI